MQAHLAPGDFFYENRYLWRARLGGELKKLLQPIALNSHYWLGSACLAICRISSFAPKPLLAERADMQFPVRATPKLYRFLLDRPLMNYSSLNELRIKLRDWDSKRILCFLRLRFFKYLLRLVDRRRICAFNSFAFAQLAPSVAYAYSPSEYGFVMAVLRLFIDTKDAASGLYSRTPHGCARRDTLHDEPHAAAAP